MTAFEYRQQLLDRLSKEASLAEQALHENFRLMASERDQAKSVGYLEGVRSALGIAHNQPIDGFPTFRL